MSSKSMKLELTRFEDQQPADGADGGAGQRRLESGAP
jgi:hypothetical protein